MPDQLLLVLARRVYALHHRGKHMTAGVRGVLPARHAAAVLYFRIFYTGCLQHGIESVQRERAQRPGRAVLLAEHSLSGLRNSSVHVLLNLRADRDRPINAGLGLGPADKEALFPVVLLLLERQKL